MVCRSLGQECTCLEPRLGYSPHCRFEQLAHIRRSRCRHTHRDNLLYP